MPSTGVNPAGVPLPSKVIAATFSSASLSFFSQRAFNAAPRSYSAMDFSNSTSPRSNWPTTCSSSRIAASKLISSTGVSLIWLSPSKPRHAPPPTLPKRSDHIHLPKSRPRAHRSAYPPHYKAFASTRQSHLRSIPAAPGDHLCVHQIRLTGSKAPVETPPAPETPARHKSPASAVRRYAAATADSSHCPPRQFPPASRYPATEGSDGCR
mmetsp:Transcript_13326/g.21096  ORF Transcript_13326/g.21096 Transcript_13326/m.21096 type:complete len:210 (-) Transcript_13326:1797-2426(-)